jgi:hypothetical protein
MGPLPQLVEQPEKAGLISSMKRGRAMETKQALGKQFARQWRQLRLVGQVVFRGDKIDSLAKNLYKREQQSVLG